MIIGTGRTATLETKRQYQQSVQPLHLCCFLMAQYITSFTSTTMMPSFPCTCPVALVGRDVVVVASVDPCISAVPTWGGYGDVR